MEHEFLIKGIIKAAEMAIAELTNKEVVLIVKPMDSPAGKPEEMMRVIALALELTMDDYFEGRQRKYVDLRCLAALFINRYYAHLPLKKTSQLMGGLDHTSIINYMTRAKHYLGSNEDVFCDKYEKVKTAIAQWIKEQ